MMEKLLRGSWGVIAIAVLFATAVSARDLATMKTEVSNSENQPDKSMQTLKSFLDDLGDHYKVSIGYDATLVENAYVSKNEKITNNLDKDLKKVLKSHGLKFEKIEKDHYVIVSRRSKHSVKELKKASFNAPEMDISNLLVSQAKVIGFETPEEIYQERRVTGKITSSDNNEALPGVNVVVKGTNTGGITDLDGNYSVNFHLLGWVKSHAFRQQL